MLQDLHDGHKQVLAKVLFEELPAKCLTALVLAEAAALCRCSWSHYL